MPDKGKIMSQTYYEKQDRLIKLYHEAFSEKEMDDKETVTALRKFGFSETMAVRLVSKWTIQIDDQLPKTNREKKRRIKERASLEKYTLRMNLGKKRYEEYIKKQSSRE